MISLNKQSVLYSVFVIYIKFGNNRLMKFLHTFDFYSSLYSLQNFLYLLFDKIFCKNITMVAGFRTLTPIWPIRNYKI